jgi:hypothetical protein
VGYQKIVDPKGVQTFKGRKSLRNKRLYEGGRKRSAS